MRNTRLLGLMALLIIGGCSTAAQLEGTRIDDVSAKVALEYDQCEGRIYQQLEFAQITPKLPPPGGKQPSIALLANEQRPTESEANTLITLRDAMQPCDSAALEGIGKIHPSVVAVVAESYRQYVEAYLKLVKREVAWGQFARIDQAIRTDMGTRLAIAYRQIGGELAAANVSEMQQRQAAASALMAWSAYQQQIQAQQNIANAINRPRFTQCRYVGVYLQCNSM